ncbi:MAG: hypothetical protein ACXW0R_08820 [Gaiellaceae bacterium]
MPDARECLSAHQEETNSLLAALGCQTPIGACLLETEGQTSLLFGDMGRPTAPARLHVRPVARWIEYSETWDFLDEVGRVSRGSYRYALFEGNPEERADPLVRYEFHPFPSGRSREIYGGTGFAHVHIGSDRRHLPAETSFERFLRFVVSEETGLTDAEAARLVELTRQSEARAREWRAE